MPSRLRRLAWFDTALEIADSTNHLLDNTHGIFIQSIAEEVTVDDLNEVHCMDKWEFRNDFL